MSTRFKSLQIHDWRQFDHVEINFHDRLTVLTGANGAGKTALLNILGSHFGWSVSLVATKEASKKGVAKYLSGLRPKKKDAPEVPVESIGELTYDDGMQADLNVPRDVAQSFGVGVTNQQPIQGVFLSSHRPVYTYKQVDQIPTTVSARQQIFDQYYSNMIGMYQPQARYDSPSFRLKSALISLATFGYGNQAVEGNEEAVATFEGFEQILRKVLPKRLGFSRLSVRMPEVVLECDTGDFSLDAASGGVAAVIDVAWQLYMKSLIVPNFVTVFDEPENHLHPEMQREIMPGLLEAFPSVQFIVATHNPFVVTSVPDSNVVVLDYEDARVVSRHLAEVDRSASADRILTDVLGLPAPIPLWVERRFDEIVNNFNDRELTAATLQQLRAEMSQAGLGGVFPEMIERIATEKDSAT
jgi:predicted ATPase